MSGFLIGAPLLFMSAFWLGVIIGKIANNKEK